MDVDGYSIRVSGDGDIKSAWTEIWRAARKFVGAYTDSSTHGVYSFLEDGGPYMITGGDDGVLGWMFDDPGGYCYRSRNVWPHWLGLAFAVEWDSFVYRAKSHGVTVVSEQPDLGDLLTATPQHFVVLRDTLWQVHEDGLYGDDRYVSVQDLTAEERARFEAARERCRCNLCVMLRPDDPATIERLRHDLEGTTPDRTWTATHFLISMQHARPDVLAALIKAGPTAGVLMEGPISRYAPRVPGAWPMLRSLLPTLDHPVAYDLALYALSHVLERGREAETGADRGWFIRELHAASDPSGRASQAATSLLRLLDG